MIQLHEDSVLANAHAKSLISSIRARAEFAKKKKRLYYQPKITVTSNAEKCLDKLLVPNELEKILYSTPKDLINILKEYNKLFPEHSNSKTNTFKLLKNIFDIGGYENINKWEFINHINVKTCPYCNRSYIYSLSPDKKIKPEIDHFYPKSIYPLLSASFYNLIPCCETCNGFAAKGGIDSYKRKLVSPYLLLNNSFIFDYNILSIDIDSPLSGSSVDVFFVRKEKVNNKIFRLEELYKLHADHVIELIIKRNLKYSVSYRKYLQTYRGLKFSQTEIDRLILGNYTDKTEFHKRPLAKLYYDIGIQLGLISL